MLLGKQKQGERGQAGGISPGQICTELPRVRGCLGAGSAHLEARKPRLYTPRCKAVGRVSPELPGGSSCEPLAPTVEMGVCPVKNLGGRRTNSI